MCRAPQELCRPFSAACCTCPAILNLCLPMCACGKQLHTRCSLCLSHLCGDAVTAAEAGQAKELLVLDDKFEVVDTIPISIGPRNFVLLEGSTDVPSGLRKGDRCLPTLSLQDPQTQHRYVQPGVRVVQRLLLAAWCYWDRVCLPDCMCLSVHFSTACAQSVSPCHTSRRQQRPTATCRLLRRLRVPSEAGSQNAALEGQLADLEAKGEPRLPALSCCLAAACTLSRP